MRGVNSVTSPGQAKKPSQVKPGRIHYTSCTKQKVNYDPPNTLLSNPISQLKTTTLPPSPDKTKRHPPPHPTPPSLHNPPLQISTLADIEPLQLMAPLHHGLHAHARDPHAAAHRKEAHLQQVQADAAQGGVRDGGAAEGEVEVVQVRAAEGEDFGGGVGEGAAEGLGGGWLLACGMRVIGREGRRVVMAAVVAEKK